MDFLLLRKYPFYGRLNLIEFLKRIWDLSSMPSTDRRFKDVEGDIYQHMINNSDWEYDYLLYQYLDLLKCENQAVPKLIFPWKISSIKPLNQKLRPKICKFWTFGTAWNEIFLKFIEICLHPVVLPDEKQASDILFELNTFLAPDGYRLEVSSLMAGKPIYKAIRFNAGEEFVSASTDITKVKKVITFSPSVFNIPEKPIDNDLVSVMMPFAMEFDNVLDTIKTACSNVGMSSKRVDDIWNNSTIVQDIFEFKVSQN